MSDRSYTREEVREAIIEIRDIDPDLFGQGLEDEYVEILERFGVEVEEPTEFLCGFYLREPILGYVRVLATGEVQIYHQSVWHEVPSDQREEVLFKVVEKCLEDGF